MFTIAIFWIILFVERGQRGEAVFIYCKGENA